MVLHAGCARRENRDVAAALLYIFKLIVLDNLADLVVRCPLGYGPRQRAILEARELGRPELHMGIRRKRLVTVTVDNHELQRFF